MGHVVKVLLVEDNPDDALLALRTLRRRYPLESVVVVADGSEAIDFLLATGPQSHRAGEPLPELVLLDLRLPKVSGIQVLQWLRADKRTQALPVAVLTSAQDDRTVVEVHRLGVVDYVVKPLTPEGLSRILEKIPAHSARS
jgi:two-component system response regulator